MLHFFIPWYNTLFDKMFFLTWSRIAPLEGTIQLICIAVGSVFLFMLLPTGISKKFSFIHIFIIS